MKSIRKLAFNKINWKMILIIVGRMLVMFGIPEPRAKKTNFSTTENLTSFRIQFVVPKISKK